MSFRTRVLDALDIHKKSIKIQVNESFPPVYSESSDNSTLTGTTGAYDSSNYVPYAVSKEVISSTIGPGVNGGTVKQTLDVLGFVLGNSEGDAVYKNMYPNTMPLVGSSNDGDQSAIYNGFHSLGGLYDVHSTELKSMRKSAIPDRSYETMHAASGVSSTDLPDHGHLDWPDNTLGQIRLLTENPYADALFYHSTRISFLLTGITIPDMSEKASNHRGVVRMLILRPRCPTVKTRWSGISGAPQLNMAYPPHFDTDLFYTKTKTLAGRMDTGIYARRAISTSTSGQKDARKTHISPTFGLKKYADIDPAINQVTSNPVITGGNIVNNVPDIQLHYGHPIPNEGTDHTLSSYDVLTAPINREKYAVITDKMVTLDTLHHGVASKRIENVVIPYNKKIKFPGRKETQVTTEGGASKKLSVNVHTEPVNFQSRPIIMFLSMDQKISAQVTGYTTISEC